MMKILKAVIPGVMLIVFASAVSAQQRTEAQRYYDELIGNMTQQVKLLQDENASLSTKVSTMERRVNAVTQENQRLKQELDAMRELLRKDSAERTAQMRELFAKLEELKKLSVSAAAPQPAPQPRQGKKTSGDSFPPDQKYEEYIVQKGAVLSVIAQAYNVSVRDIKRANNLKNDTIYPGQRLLIPVK